MDNDISSGHPPDANPQGEFAVFLKANLYRFLPVARRYAGFRGLPSATAPDIVQEALRRTWSVWQDKLASKLDEQRCALVYATMRHVAQEFQRQHAQAGASTDPMDFPDNAGAPVDLEDHHLACAALRNVQRAWTRLSGNERAVIELAIAQLRHKEIAERLNLKPSNISTILLRARRKLAAAIDPSVAVELRLQPGTAPPGGAA